MSERIDYPRTEQGNIDRQLLLDRSPLPALTLFQRLSLQAQLANPPYIGLWTRLRNFRQVDLTSLLEQRQVMRATMMRSTLHLMTADDYLLLRPLLQPALTRALHAFFAKEAKGIDVNPFVLGSQNICRSNPDLCQVAWKLTGLFPAIDPALMAYVVRTHLPLVQIPPGVCGDLG